MQNDQIEILLASYQGAPYIREQLDSILNQTDSRWHLTVSDDGSADDTDQILDEYERRFPSRIRRVRSKRRFGCAKTHFMWLTQQCDAPYIAYCDQDDVWLPDKLEKMRRRMEEMESETGSDTPVLVFSDQTVTDEQLNTIAPSLMRMQQQYTDEIDWRALLFQNIVTGGACLFNRALAKLVCACRDVSQIIMHDWWLAIVAARFGKVVYLDESTGYYRQHEGNSVGAKDVGSIAHITYQIGHMGELKRTIRMKKAQAAMLQDTYGSRLDEEDMRFIRRFARERSGVFFYLQYGRYVHTFWRLAGMAVLG